LSQLKQTAFATLVGDASGFQETDDGGFIVFVQLQLPVDETIMESDMPQFAAELRQRRQSEAFNEWLMREANRSLKDTPIFSQPAATGAAPAQ
jgi:hypothetical protein